MTREQVRTIEPGAGIWDLETGDGGTVVQIIDTLNQGRDIQVRWNLSGNHEMFSGPRAMIELGLSFHAAKGAR